MALAYTAPTWVNGSGTGISASQLQALSDCMEGLVQGSDKAITNISISGQTITLTFADGSQETGTASGLKGISSIAKTGTSGNVDTYTITYTDGSTSTFTVTNGADGSFYIVTAGIKSTDDPYGNIEYYIGGDFYKNGVLYNQSAFYKVTLVDETEYPPSPYLIDGSSGTFTNGHYSTGSIGGIPSGATITTQIFTDSTMATLLGEVKVLIGLRGSEGEQGPQGPAGDDGVSPEVTITTITGGHRVNITDATHPQGQEFDVMDGQGTGDMQMSVYDSNGDVANAGGIAGYVSDKADKVSNVTNGNFAGLDANGNLTDSGKSSSDFLPSNTPIPDEVIANPTGTATGTLTKLGIGSDIYDIQGGGTDVEANPSGTATDTLTKLRVDNTIYGIDSGGSITPKVLASVTGDGVKTFNQLFDELYLQLLPIEFDKLIGTVLVTGATCYFLSRISVNDQDVEYSTEYTLASQWGTHDVYLKSSGSSLRVISINNSVISYNDGGQNVAPSGRVIQIVKPSAYVASSGTKNLLWTNSGLSATVADANDTFPATNSIPQVRNDQGYDYFIIVCRNHACRLMEVNYLLYPDQNDPNNGRAMVAVSTAYNGTAWKSCRRQFVFWNTGSAINTLNCSAGGEIASDGALSENNHYLIPYKIYGVKL